MGTNLENSLTLLGVRWTLPCVHLDKENIVKKWPATRYATYVRTTFNADISPQKSVNTYLNLTRSTRKILPHTEVRFDFNRKTNARAIVITEAIHCNQDENRYGRHNSSLSINLHRRRKGTVKFYFSDRKHRLYFSCCISKVKRLKYVFLNLKKVIRIK